MISRILELLTFFTISLLFLPRIEAVTKCVRAHGQVHCATDVFRHEKVKISLYDHDSLPWESDDLMGRTYSDDEGRFMVEGCGDDFGPWNEPDPYIVVEHRCPLQGHTVAITRRKTM
ncbi:unnamed protein product, partial [Mesorhabditis belari]|uniref:Uncharacterized protein n=1 Tax=Mesorhabditis belari TaxID=2138241 RepID=A0AAF3ECB0_9BILA